MTIYKTQPIKSDTSKNAPHIRPFSKQDLEFQKFISILENWEDAGNKEYTTAFSKQVLPINCKDYRVHFFKSHYFRVAEKNIPKALREIQRSLKSLSSVNTSADHGFERDNISLTFVNGKLIDIVPPRDVYFIAGELYAMSGMNDDALKCYQKYQINSKTKSLSVTSLYSFRPFNIYSISDLINREITVCRPILFNDPYDSLALSWINNIGNTCKEPLHVDTLKHSYDYFRIRSFVEDKPKQIAYKNMLMWAHYAGNHTGFCIKYDFDEEFVNGDQCLYFKRVCYQKPSKKVNLSAESLSSDIAFHTKLATWKYENEVRLISYIPECDQDAAKIKMGEHCRISDIYFGLKCPPEHIETITKILKGSDVRFHQFTDNIKDIYHPIEIDIV